MATRATLWGAGAGAAAYGTAARSLGWQIAAVGSRTDRRARSLADQIAAGEVFALDSGARSATDLSIVVTPPTNHATAVERVGLSGDVIVVAPLAATLADADRMVGASPSTTRLLGWALISAPTTQELMRRVGAVGTPTSMTMSISRPLPEWGQYASGKWGGGALLFAGHDHIALTLLLAQFVGLGTPVSVSATMSLDARHVDRSARVQLQFSETFSATVESAWTTDGSPRSDVQLAGSDGVLRIDSDPTPTLEHNGDAITVRRPAVPDERLRPLHDAGLVDLLKTARSVAESDHSIPHALTFEFGRSVIEVIAAASWSAGLDGTPVPLPFTGSRDQTPIDLVRTAAAV